MNAANEYSEEVFKNLLALVNSNDSRSVLEFIKENLPDDLINRTDKNGRTCLSYAAGNGDVMMTEIFLSYHPTDPNIGDNDGNTPLIYAASLGHRLCLVKLLKHPALDIDKCNKSGFTALMKAAIHGHQPCLDVLLQAGADNTKTDFSRGMTALHWAKLVGSQACTKQLRKHKRNHKPSICKLSQSATDLRTTTSEHQQISDQHDHHTPFIQKIKKSIKHHSKHKEQLGIEGIVTCASTPAIPILVAFSSNKNDITETLLSPVLLRKHNHLLRSCRGKTDITIQLPRIEITTDTGEIIEPGKQNFKQTQAVIHVK